MKFLIILGLIISTLSCHNKKEFDGNWNSCDSEEGYFEFHINDNEMEIYLEGDDEVGSVPYQLEKIKDTIYLYCGEMFNEDDPFTHLLIVKSITKNQFTFDFITPDNVFINSLKNKEYTLNRINDKIEHSKISDDINQQLKTYAQWEKRFFKRKEKYKCNKED